MNKEILYLIKESFIDHFFYEFRPIGIIRHENFILRIFLSFAHLSFVIFINMSL